MQLNSSAFQNAQLIPLQYGCHGQGISPPLEISGTPNNTQSLVLIVDDPDSPNPGWVHWVLFNIDPQTTQIPENNPPTNAIAGINDFGKVGWGGPCPHSGVHKYSFRIYALDTQLDMSSGATKSEVMKNMQGHVLDMAELTGTYSFDTNNNV